VRGSGPRGSSDARDTEILSPRLVSAVRDRLEKGEQCILLLNRRGYSAFVQCRACGGVRECPNCSITLTFHRSRGRLLCHHCRHDEAKPDRCAACGADDLSFRGLGTEQVERVVAETFPSARIARMDLDTTSGRWSHHEILGRVERREVDLLLGTQMIAKGLDFPGITLVGVVNADVGMHLPDFRATERTFQLLSQVAGRAGRGPLGGEVIVQTSLPDHFAIEAVVAHDVPGFVDRELKARRDPAYPPHARLANVVVSSPDRALAADAAEGAARWVRKALAQGSRGRGGRGGGGPSGAARIELVGPAPSPIERLHRRWRWHFFLRGGGVREGTRLLTRFAAEYRPPAGDVRVAIDRDPVALL
jgi:primosomal protein N' (replication factor Y)